jgi:hypothetical protein
MPMMGKKMKVGGMTSKPKKMREGGMTGMKKPMPAATRSRARGIEKMPVPRQTLTEEQMRDRAQSEAEMGSAAGEIDAMLQRRAAGYKKGGKVSAKPMKMQKGGMVPCKSCPNPAACKRAGRCMMAG